MSDSQSPYQSDHPNWLQRVQEQSWEPELIISGLVLFALFQIPEMVDAGIDYLNVHSIRFFSQFSGDETIGALINTAVFWLIIGFITLIILRSIWLAYVGLSYVYDKGIKRDGLGYHPLFLKHVNTEQTYVPRIKKLERICSSLFAVTFMFVLFIIGVLSFFLIFTALIYYLVTAFPKTPFSWIDPFITITTGVYMVDFMTLGLIRRIPYLSVIYYPFYWILHKLTFAPLYESIYFGFVSNHKWWKIAPLIITFIVGSVFVANYMRNELSPFEATKLSVDDDHYVTFRGHYEDRAGEDASRRAYIPSEVVRGDLLRIFAVHNVGNEERYILPLCEYERKVEENPDIDVDSLRWECLNGFYDVAINDSTYTEKALIQKDVNTGYRGLVHWIDISHLPNGPHMAKVIHNRTFEDSVYNVTVALIEFQKQTTTPPPAQ